jgi:hypothetical protein
MKQLFGLDVRDHVPRSRSGAQRVTVITKGIPTAQFFATFEDGGWRMECPPIETNYYRDMKSFWVTFVSIPGEPVTQPQ